MCTARAHRTQCAVRPGNAWIPQARAHIRLPGAKPLRTRTGQGAREPQDTAARAQRLGLGVDPVVGNLGQRCLDLEFAEPGVRGLERASVAPQGCPQFQDLGISRIPGSGRRVAPLRSTRDLAQLDLQRVDLSFELVHLGASIVELAAPGLAVAPSAQRVL